MGTEQSWSTTGSCPAQLPDPKKKRKRGPLFHTRSHPKSPISFLWDVFCDLVSPLPHWSIEAEIPVFQNKQHIQCGGLQSCFCRTKQGQNITKLHWWCERRTSYTVYQERHSFSCPLLSLWWLFLLWIDRDIILLLYGEGRTSQLNSQPVFKKPATDGCV